MTALLTLIQDRMGLAGPGRHGMQQLRLAGIVAAVMISAFTVASSAQAASRDLCPSRPGQVHCMAQVALNARTRQPLHPRPAATVPMIPSLSQLGSPAYIQQAYDLSYLSTTAGSGQTVALVEVGYTPTAEADLGVFRTEFGFAACTSSNGCLRQVDQNGGAIFPKTSSTGWKEETALDLDAVSTICPNCHIVIVSANSQRRTDLARAEAEAAASGASEISNSWSVDGRNRSALPGRYVFPGIRTLAAAGDGSDLGTGFSAYPAALSGVTAVGGTSLYPSFFPLTINPRGLNEIPWLGDGDETGTASGCDLTQPKPSWQHDRGCPGRSWVDIAADGDPGTGLDVYSSLTGWERAGGTSLATPLVAAYYALNHVTKASWPYQQHGLLFDIDNGTDGSCSIRYLCFAQVGYDGPSGNGTISGQVAPGAPNFAQPSSHGYTTNVTPTTADLTAGIYPNGRATTYSWSYGPVGSPPVTTAPASVDQRRLILTSSPIGELIPGTVYRYQLTLSNSLGQTTSSMFQFTTPTLATPVLISAQQAGSRLHLHVACSTGSGNCHLRLYWRTPLAAHIQHQGQLLTATMLAGHSAQFVVPIQTAKNSIITAQRQLSGHWVTVSAVLVGS